MLYDKTLSIKLINTYKAFKELNDNGTTDSENANWCNTLTNLLTSKATELEQDVQFQELVDALQLNGSLLAV